MIASRLIRTAAAIGALGGALRVIGSFAPMLMGAAGRTWLYVATDTCLAAGVVGLYLPRRHRMPATGVLGAFLTLGGLIAGRIGPVMTDVDVYPMTAAAVVIGVSMFAFSEWRLRRLAAWIPLTFALCLVVGSIGTFVDGASALFTVSGILFGSAFAAMAIRPAISSAHSPADSSAPG